MQDDPGHPSRGTVREQRPVDQRHAEPSAAQNRQPHVRTLPPTTTVDDPTRPGGGRRRIPRPAPRTPPAGRPPPARNRVPHLPETVPEIPLTGEDRAPPPS
ncbi:hypothetical protein GCM10017779_55600 [Streptomyces capillispiralis]|nr:hypothetical protein GCM10017779_55600 [Streptomyces capillispiralis]